jgi:hypothetical protein
MVLGRRLGAAGAVLALASLSLTLLAPFGCSAAAPPGQVGVAPGGTEPNQTGNDGSPSKSPPVLVADAGSSEDGSSGPSGGGDGCSDASKLVYVISRDSDLYSFEPGSFTFTHIGTISCPSEDPTSAFPAFPFSMAVDRGGTAWVLFSDGNLLKVSTKDASCTSTSFVPNQAGFTLFGMGFVADGPDASTDTLYVSENVNGNGLGKIDLSTLTLTAIGPYTGALAGQKAELTGTGKGDLFGFFLTTPAQVASIATTSGSVMNADALNSVTVGTDWAFSFWGGDFYLYTGNSTDTAQNGSTVTRYSPSDGGVTVLSNGLGFFIDGAGVSTCAPTTPPPPPDPR